MSQFTDADQANATKGAVHGALLVLVLMCLAYNFCAWRRRREWRLLGNALIYLAVAIFEIVNIRRHRAS